MTDSTSCWEVRENAIITRTFILGSHSHYFPHFCALRVVATRSLYPRPIYWYTCQLSSFARAGIGCLRLHQMVIGCCYHLTLLDPGSLRKWPNPCHMLRRGLRLEDRFFSFCRAVYGFREHHARLKVWAMTEKIVDFVDFSVLPKTTL